MINENLVIENLRLVDYVLRNIIKIHPTDKSKSVRDYEDLYQQGCYALCLAASRFNESKGYSFSTIAVPYISGIIKTYMRDKDCLMRYSRDDSYIRNKILKICFDKNLDKEDTDDLKIAYENSDLDCSFDHIKQILTNNIVPLDSNIKSFDGEPKTVYETIPCESSELEFQELIFSDFIDNCIDKLVKSNFKDKYIDLYVEYIYTVIIANEKLSQKYFAQKYGVSQSYSSRLIKTYNEKLLKIIQDEKKGT